MDSSPKIPRLLLLLLCVLAMPHDAWCQVAATASAPAPVRRALLVGINVYASKDVPRLRGCVNDVESMRALLTSRFGFEAANVRMLTDAAATRAGILDALGKLVDETLPDDVVFFDYAGHGSQVKDFDGDEPDGKDETIVPQDGRTADVPDITDDELAAMFARLRARSAVIVLDCCHSGTGTRSISVQARQIDEDTRTDLYSKHVATRAIVPLPSERYVLMTGAADTESALDGPIEGGWHGAFSFALVRALSAAPAGASPRAIFQEAQREMRRLGDQWMIASMPEPQLEAPAASLDAALLPPAPRSANAASVSPRVAWSEVKVDPDTHRAWLDAQALGSAVGAIWAVYPPDETAFAQNGSFAVCDINSIEQGRAYLDVQAGADGANTIAAIKPGSRAVLSSPPPGTDETPVCLSGASSERIQALAAQLSAALPGFQSVGPSEVALLHVELQDSGFRVLGADGVSLVATCHLDPKEDAAPKLVAAIQRCLDAATLMTLDNPSSHMRLELAIGTPSSRAATRVGERGFKVVADNAAPVFHFRSGDRNTTNSLQLSVRANTDCYITIVDIDAEGSMRVLFPNDYSRATFHPEGRIAASEWVRIPDSLEEHNQAGFYWDASAPAGLDTVRVFASTDIESAQDLREGLVSIEKSGEDLVGRGLEKNVHASRRAALRALRRQIAQRGFKVVGGDAAPAPPAPNGASATPTPSAPPASPTPASAEPTASPTSPEPTPDEPPDSDWTATSITVRIEP